MLNLKKIWITTPWLTMATPLALRLAEFSFKHSKADSPTRQVGELFLDYEYLRKFEAKSGTDR
jgi:hypothetical protein